MRNRTKMPTEEMLEAVLEPVHSIEELEAKIF